MDAIDLVNPLQGTESDREYSTGLCFPLVGRVRGLTYFSPQTSDTPFLFDYGRRKISGFRATHCPSAWMGDFGHFDIMPVVGDIGPLPHVRASAYHRERQRAQPHCYRTRLLRYDVDCEMTATRSCGVFRFTYPEGSRGRAAFVVQTGSGKVSSLGEVSVQQSAEGVRVLGWSGANSGGAEGGFGCFYVIDLPGAVAAGIGTVGPKAIGEGSSARGDRAGVFVRLGGGADRSGDTIIARVATSFVSHEQALLNLEREVGEKSFEVLVAEGARHWERWLSRVRPRCGSEQQLRVLYSCMYRVGLFPTALHEFDAVGQAMHRSPYDGNVRQGVLYTNQGLWDAYHTVYPLLAVIDRTGYGEIVQGFLEAYKQTGWFPRWPSPGLRQCMIGSHGDVVVAEAVAAGITGFDYAEAYEAVRKNAYHHSDDPRLGRAGLNDYLALGYVPGDVNAESVCWTLDNAHCDWCIAQLARRLGHEQDASDLLRRSGNYRNLWHPGSRLMRPRNSDGSWVEPWREFEWGGAYVEGGPWQHSLHVPHDPVGLAELHGGVDALLDRLDEMFRLPPVYERGTYWEEIHEMTEVALATDEEGRSFGQYAHSNQPVHNYLFLAAALGRPQRSVGHVQRVMQSLYTPTTFPGDEDNGEMSAWYVLCAAGQVPACPGSGRLATLNVPTFGPAELLDLGPQ